MLSMYTTKIICLKSEKFAHFLRCKYSWKASICKENRSIIMTRGSNGDEILKFPTVWLRDNCRCSSCFDEKLQSRIITLKKFTSRILPKTIDCEKRESGKFELNIIWPDEHESVYDLEWLKRHNFDKKYQTEWLEENYTFRKTIWNSSNFVDLLQTFSYEELIQSDSELLKWLITLNEKGIAIVKNAGNNENAIQKLTDRVGFIKKTTYGTLFKVEASKDATNAAYRSDTLQLHVDLPYYEYCPNFIILHYLIQSKAENEGANVLADGLEICRQLKNHNNGMYRILTSTLIEWTDISKHDNYQMHHIHRSPVINEDAQGNITRVNFSQHQRDSHFNVSIEKANKWYEAMNHFVSLAFHPENLVKLKIEQGDMLTFDNLRVLHGRESFSSKRYLIGAYLDADVVNSRIRVLRSQLNFPIVDCDDFT